MPRSSSNNPFRTERNPARDIAARLHDVFLSAERDNMLGTADIAKVRDGYAKLSEQPVEKQKVQPVEATATKAK